MMALMSGIVVAFSDIPRNFGDIAIAYIRYLVLLSNIVPVSDSTN